ncbi:SusC/RagA family TonB-linked outer membrane protein [Flavobacterium sp. AJR]|uniref:SusC/RagA family TonB-linked outer membrane protein n=1 Tax=Flavobacterium sp. AJR TaxID=1979369 RepID=UPI00057F2AD7|nr:SusC/RagA family TonB-linked outer membrane protein [Flavobacterium sp. AJR]KIC03089.1 membrane protein [Flavobacterium sp. JRM]OUL63217.1 SusC/RagA family TonB-linked outer membrane protein [Flavobacterium sp. AJR]
MKLKFNGFLVLLVVLMTQLTIAQERTVSGIVSDNAGMPLPGVSVLVKGTQSGTQTDFDGKYSIKATPSQVLVFSYIGMKSQEITASSATVNAKLASSSVELEGVVVTALGIKREKKSLGYASQEIKGADLNSGAASGNFLNELSGKAAGVNIRKNTNFGGSTNVVSRGVKNLTGDNQMLIVIDGMPINNANTNSSVGKQTEGARNTYDYGNAAMDINPDDIETLNILKGAAAAALYGWQAGNGVIMITTKKGKARKGMGVTISSEFTVGTVDKKTFPVYQNKYGQGYGPTYDDAGNPKGIPVGPTGAFFTIDSNGNQVATTTDDASYGVAFDPNLSIYQWDAYTKYSPNYGKKTTWKAAENGPITFFQSATTFNNSISIEDGTEKTNFVLNYNNYKENGILPNSELKKNNISLKINHKFTDKLSASAFANYMAQTTVGRNTTGYGGDNIMGSFRQWWATNVDIQAQKDVFENSGGQNISWNMANPANGNTSAKYADNPYFTRYKNYQSDERNRFIGYAQLDYKVANWLSVTGKASTDSYSELREERKAVGSLNATFGINRLAVGSGYQKYAGMFSEQNYQLTLNFNKKITQDISLNGLAGLNALRTRRTSTLASTDGGLIIPGIFALSNSLSPSPYPVEEEDNSGVNSAYASVSLGYKDFLFLDGTVRNDVFSTLPKGSNSVNTFSTSASYVFTNHINQPWLTFGKFRASYAENPQGNIDLYSLQSVFSKFNNFGSNPLYSRPNISANPDLHTVKTKSEELGLEMQFFDRRAGFEVSVYKSLSSDQIFPVDYSTATGYSSRYANAGSVENKGIEVQFNLTPVKLKDFQWDVFVNWSKNENTIKDLAPGIEVLTLGSFQGGVSIVAKPGNAFGDIIGKDYVYAADGQKVTKGGTYLMTESVTNVIGNVTPDWIGGIRNKFTYKQVSLGFLIDMQKGGDIFSLDQYYGQNSGLYESTAGFNELGNPVRNTLANGGGVILPGVNVDGTPNTTRTPGPEVAGGIYGYNKNPQKAFIYDASYIKLREVTITYSFPSALVSKLSLTDLRLSLIGSNLWIIHKNLPDADPESGLSSGNLSSGYSGGSLPTTRNIGCNLTLKF